MSFGENLKRARLARRLTQEQLGKKVGMTQSAVGQFEKMEKAPKYETVKKFADALAVTIPYLDENYGIDFGSDILVEDENGHYHVEEDNEIYESIPRLRIRNALDNLNDTGQDVAADRVEELTEIPKYQKK